MTVKLPRRTDFGGHGSAGRKIALKANFFPVQLPFSNSIFHYDVEVEKVYRNPGDEGRPARDLPKKLCESVVQQFINDYRNSVFKNGKAAYDSRKNIYTSGRISLEILPHNQRKAFEVQYRKPGGQRTEAFEVKLRYAQEIPLNSIKQALAGRKELDPTTIQALDKEKERQ